MSAIKAGVTEFVHCFDVDVASESIVAKRQLTLEDPTQYCHQRLKSTHFMSALLESSNERFESINKCDHFEKDEVFIPFRSLVRLH